MNRIKTAVGTHEKGFNCCQSVLSAFADRLGVDEQTYQKLGSGFGGGAGTGELCGAITGAIMALDLIFPADFSDPVSAKKKAVLRSKLLQQGFEERFGHLRCRELLSDRRGEDAISPAVKELNLTNHCSVMIATAVELAEEILKEER
ncbi:MAG: C-GCAxxG-C-C family protein [Eubacteriales bacterium]|nr:C-GCAxxG-C-C family protein [Eubacteriales bacterium]